METMEVSLTIFDNVYDNKTVKRMDYESFEQFESVLYRLAESSKYPTKTKAPLISPATYLPDSTRANDNVVAWGGFGIIDVDDFKGDIKEIESKYEQYKYLCYSTASSSIENPKFRLVFPLTEWIDKEKIKHFWFALNKEIGGIADAQTKDLSRMYYIPSQYKNSFNFIFSHDGEVMDPNDLMVRHKYVLPADSFYDRLPEAIKKGLMEHRKSQLNNTDISWTGYKDCPFVNKKKIQEYKGLNAGWYYAIYQMMVSIAGNAITKGYPITAKEVEFLIRDLDSETGNWYLKRPIEREAERAIEFVFRKNI
jgi:hypothetical protein